MACVLTLDDGNEMYTLTGETGYVWCAVLRKLWRMSSISCLIALLRVQSADLFQQGCTVADFLSKNEPNACGGFIRNCFSLRGRILNE